MNLLLTSDVAEQAVERVLPIYEAMCEAGAFKRTGHFAIVVGTHDGNTFNHLFGKQIGEVRDWEHPYFRIAVSKAEITARTGRSSREAHEVAPWLLEQGDTLYWGSAIEDNIVVACSGVQPWYDEMLSKMIIAAIKAICTELVLAKRDAASDEDDFFGADTKDGD